LYIHYDKQAFVYGECLFKEEELMRIVQERFGEMEGKIITATTLINHRGMEVTSINYGCIITSILTPDQYGIKENIVLGFDSLEEYKKHSPYFGAVVGRFAGRIQGSSFTLDGVSYHLPRNNGQNHLHGGVKGFDKAIWDIEVVMGKQEAKVVYSYLSPDGEEGYPGNLHIKVIYTLSDRDELTISYEAVSDKNTLLNVTNHSYFNLSGNLKRDTLEHELTIKSDFFLELGEDLIPTGELLSVQGTTFDFRQGRKLQDGIQFQHPQNKLAGGYDHPFVLNEHNNREIELRDKESGRMLTIETDQPSVVLYSGSQLSSDYTIRGVQCRKYLGVCLETQGFPDNIHHPHLPSTILEAGKVYQSQTKYLFGLTEL
jgi:aldose 1-epimerase